MTSLAKMPGAKERDAVTQADGSPPDRPTYEELLARVAQLEQRQQQQHFVELVESIQDGFLALDDQWRFTYVNRRAAQNVGFRPEDLVGRDMWDLFPKLRGTEAEHAYRRVMAERAPVTIEVQGVITDAWYRLSIYPATQGITIFWSDVSDRKRAEEALKKSEERFRTLASNAQDTIARFDRECRFVYANPFIERLYGRPLEELAGKTVAELGRSAGTDQWEERLREVFKTGKPLHFDRRTPEGWWFDVQLMPEFEGVEVKTVLSTSRNITERKRAEEALRESEQKYRSIVETAAEGIVIARPDGPYTFVNKQMAEMLGYAPEELLGKSSVDLSSGEWGSEVLHVRGDLKRGNASQGEFKFRCKDGSELWSRWSAAPIFNEKGEHVANLAMHTDVTERKRDEERLAADLAALKRMHALSCRMVEATSIEPLLQETMDAAVAIVAADKGTLQLLKGTPSRS
jgi:PAS domain S-box-containing protein